MKMQAFKAAATDIRLLLLLSLNPYFHRLTLSEKKILPLMKDLT